MSGLLQRNWTTSATHMAKRGRETYSLTASTASAIPEVFTNVASVTAPRVTVIQASELRAFNSRQVEEIDAFLRLPLITPQNRKLLKLATECPPPADWLDAEEEMPFLPFGK